MNGSTATINNKQKSWMDGFIDTFKKETKTQPVKKEALPGIKTKKCSICGKELPLDAEHFYKNKGSKDGFRRECVTCFKEYRKNQSAKKKTAQPKKDTVKEETPVETIKIRINDENIVGIIKDGNNILPLMDLMKAVYGTRHQAELSSIRENLNKFITKEGTKLYVSLMGIGLIMESKGDKEMLDSITRQALQLPKIKKDPVEALYDGIVGMANVNNLFKQVNDAVKNANKDQNDLLHYLENNDLSDEEKIEFANNLQILRHNRRKLKNNQTLLDEQITELKNMGFKGASEAGKSVANLQEIKKKLDNSMKHHIYFKRDGSNSAEMEAKIQQLDA